MTEQLQKGRNEDNVWVETHASGEVGHNVEVIFYHARKCWILLCKYWETLTAENKARAGWKMMRSCSGLKAGSTITTKLE